MVDDLLISLILNNLLGAFPLFTFSLIAEFIAHVASAERASFGFHLDLMHLLGGDCGRVGFEDVEVVGFDDEHVVDLEFLEVDVLVEAEGNSVEAQ
jgi:hypothetical protein